MEQTIRYYFEARACGEIPVAAWRFAMYRANADAEWLQLKAGLRVNP